MSESFGESLLKFWFARALEGESQIQEHIQWDRETKGLVPLVQAAGVALGVGSVVVGLALMGWGATRAINVHITPTDALLAGVLLALALVILAIAARFIFRMAQPIVSASLAVAVFLLVVVGVLMALFGELDTGAGLALAGATAILVAGLSLAYRQLVDLLDPFGKTSPVERMMRPYLAQLFTGQQEQVNRLSVPYRINGTLREPAAAMAADGEPVVRIHRDDLALIEFIREAERRGLSRRKWLQKRQPNVVLPRSGVEVGRDIYDDMVARLAQWGIVSPGGEGKASHWMMNAADGIELIEREIVAQVIEGQHA